MAHNKKTAPTDAELSAMFEGIGEGEDDNPTSTPTSQTAARKAAPTSSNDEEDDPLAELKTLAVAPRTSTSSRPSTPRLASSAATSVRTRSPGGLRSSEMYTPTTGSGRSSEERAALDTEASRHNGASQAQTGGSWWGGLSAIASAAVKQAEAAVKEIQQNEEAQRWAEQMKGNYGALRGIGGQLSSRALPTFTNIIHTLAPPISQHERLQIHITHDLVNYPSLDPMIYEIFSRVMSQVEGGELLVIQRASESGHQRSMSDAAYTGSVLGSSGGWNDGPWWQENNANRDLGAVKGLVEGTKLVRVSAESHGNDFFNARGGIEQAAKQATEVLNESNPVRSSDIFLAIQAISHTAQPELFAAAAQNTEGKDAAEGAAKDSTADELVAFAIYLHDPIHGIAFSSLSQSIPQKWADWMDARSTESKLDGNKYVPALPDEILDIIEHDGIDPREWIAEWLQESISLAIAVVAQRYVARRMGVGEGGIGRGRRREETVESGAGEAARAL